MHHVPLDPTVSVIKSVQYMYFRQMWYVQYIMEQYKLNWYSNDILHIERYIFFWTETKIMHIKYQHF